MSDGPTLVQVLAQLSVDSVESGVPDEVGASVRQRILDVLGICIAASDLPTSEAIRGFAVSQGGPGQATAVGVTGELPATWAALVNGTLAHSLDYDDTHLPSVLHPSATVVPACLAAGQMVGASGRAVTSAVAAGLEICIRLGMAGYDEKARNSLYFDRGQHATSICGSIGAAGAVASLLGLGTAGAANAMAIAVSMAGGVIEANRTGGTVKRVHCGWGAHAAISAAMMTAAGITGPPTVLEGRFGFFRAFLNGDYDPTALTEGLGSTWWVPRINFKPYPANHFCHAGIDAAIALRSAGLQPDDVESMTLGVPAPVLHTVGEPIETKRRPETGYQAQFSGPYTVVAGLLGGHGLGVGLDDFTDQLARDPFRRELMARVNVVADEEATDVFPRQFAACLTVVTRSGEVLVERVMTNRGGAERPLSNDDLAVKFADNARRGLDEAEAAQVRDAVWALESSDDVSPCLRPLARLLH